MPGLLLVFVVAASLATVTLFLCLSAEKSRVARPQSHLANTAAAFVVVSAVGSWLVGASGLTVIVWALLGVVFGTVVVCFTAFVDGTVSDAFGLPIWILAFAFVFFLGIYCTLEETERQFQAEIQTIETDFTLTAASHDDRVLTRFERDPVLDEVIARRDALLDRYHKKIVGEWSVGATGAHLDCRYVSLGWYQRFRHNDSLAEPRSGLGKIYI